MNGLTMGFKDAAQQVGISLRMLRKLDAQGQGPATVRLGRLKRVRPEALTAWLKSREQHAA